MSQSGQTAGSQAAKSGSGVPAAAMYGNQQQQQQRGANVFDQSAGNMWNAGQNTNQAAMGYRAGMGAPAQQAGYVGDISSQMDQYQNPYTQNVINRTMADMARQTGQQQAVNAASAAQSGAFGGSRQGLVEAMTNSEAQRNFGDQSAQLRSQGFDTAANLANQDLARQMQNSQFNAGQRESGIQRMLSAAGGLLGAGGQQGQLGASQFDMGNQLNQNQMNSGTLLQQMQQQIMGNANSQFGATTGAPTNMLDNFMSMLSGNPLNNGGSTSVQSTPGLYDYASLGAQMASGKGG